MKKKLGIYLNDHLAGAAVGVRLAERLTATSTDLAEKLCFAQLLDEVKSDRTELLGVIEETGCEVSRKRQAAGATLAKPVIWRMAAHGLDYGKLGRFEMIELLADGIQAKRLLWKTLQEVLGSRPGWKGLNFRELEKRASVQLQSIEVHRLHEASLAFAKEEEEGWHWSIEETLQTE